MRDFFSEFAKRRNPFDSGVGDTWHQRLRTVAAAGMNPAKLVPMLRQIGVQLACCAPEMKCLFDQGASIRCATIDRDGAKLADVDIAPGLCP